jgi:predicted MFS family arabinose efflux permease
MIANQDIAVVAEAKTEKVSIYLWLMFAISFAGNIMGGTVSTIMAVYLPDVAKALLGEVSVEKISRISALISSLFFVGWMFGGFLWGMISDKIGRSKSLGMSIGMFGLFTLLTSFTNSWELVVTYRFLCGFGVGGMLVINTTLLSEVWPERSRAIFLGILSIGFPVGIISSGIVNNLVSDWHQAFLVGIIPLIIGVMALRMLRESVKWKTAKNIVKVNIREYRSDLISGSLIFGCMLIGLWAIFTWVPTWVQSLLSDSDGQYERGLSMMLLGSGGLAGGFLSGWVVNKLGTRRALLMCFVACFLFSFLLFKTNESFSGIVLVEIVLIAFFFGISQGALSVYIPLMFPVSIRATATGFCFNLGRLFTAAAVFFVGSLVVILGGYGNSLFTFSFVFLAGLLVMIFSKKINY